MATTNNIEALSNILTGTDDNVLFSLFNEYADNNGESHIFNMSDFNELLREREPLDIIRSIDGNFDPDDDYLYTDSYGDYCSSPNVGDVIETLSSFDELAKWCSENWYIVTRGIRQRDKYDIEDEMLTKFNEWAEEKGEIPSEWIDDNVDPEEVIQSDWNDYYCNLLTDFMEEDNED